MLKREVTFTKPYCFSRKICQILVIGRVSQELPNGAHALTLAIENMDAWKVQKETCTLHLRGLICTLQVKAAGLFKYVLPFCYHQTLKDL